MNPKSGLSRFISRALDRVSDIKVLWKEWNVPTMVITSLTLQLILIFLGPFRKKTSNGVIIVSVWLSYLMADWVAAQAVGLISREENEISAFWAQFLLLHLGGPDTITALALEDTNLWLRTGLHLAVQGYTTLGVLVRSIRTSKLWIPTILMFLAGNIKYMERVSALFCGRITKFDEDPYHYANAEELKECEPHIVFVGPPTKEESEVEMVRSAFYFFHFYKGIYADRQIKFAMRSRSKRYFDWIKTPEDTFKVLELQFHFTYEAMFTKMRITEMRSWKILRPIVMLFSVGCLVIWCFSPHKQRFERHDVLITYSLLIGAIFVDVLSIFRTQLSYRNIANYSQSSPKLAWAYNKILVLQNRNWGSYWSKEESPIWPRIKRAFFRRWSESVLQLNLMNLVMEKEKTTMLDKVAEFFDFKDTLKAFTNESKKWFPDHMRDFIVEDLKCKSLWVDINDRKASYICYAKGSYACLRLSMTNVEVRPKLHALLDVSKEYESILLHWHIITELCYCDEIRISDDEDGDGAEELNLFKRLVNKVKRKVKITKTKNAEEDADGKCNGMEEYREISKTLSDYAMYLLLRQPVMVSSIVTGNTKQMIGDAREKIDNLLPTETMGRSKEARNRRAYARFREKISEGKVDSTPPPPEPPILSWAEFPYSIHPILKDLEALEVKMGNEIKWKFIAEVWAELVYYAAIRCRPSVHAAQLKQGGELLSYIWLLMVQLGFGLHGSEHEALQFQIAGTEELRGAETDVAAMQHQSPNKTPSTEQVMDV